MLTHELNNYTMQEAMNFYPKLKAAFDVRHVYIVQRIFLLIHMLSVPRPHRCLLEQDSAIRRDQLLITYVRRMLVVFSHPRVKTT